MAITEVPCTIGFKKLETASFIKLRSHYKLKTIEAHYLQPYKLQELAHISDYSFLLN
ncbi:hypothetical protein HDE68_003196 [Pedobacter cryoconitis]|uniref:Uncharacterized protein n=1 Tax=Pedobacter cryoconitis TaxID=188932 RepID=A0A7W9DZR8_9SPHI|nr:hypothetical protein [Pedobacter cryoconitis]